MHKKVMILLLTFIFIIQPTLAGSGIAIAETVDNRSQIDIKIELLKDDDTSIKGSKVVKGDSFKTQISFAQLANDNDLETSIQLPDELRVVGESNGDLYTKDGQSVGVYEVNGRNLLLKTVPSEIDFEGTITLVSEWVEQEIEGLTNVQLEFVMESGVQILEVSFEEAEILLEEEEGKVDLEGQEPKEEQGDSSDINNETQEVELTEKKQQDTDFQEEIINEEQEVQGTEVIEEEKDGNEEEDSASYVITALASEINENIITEVRMTNAEGKIINKDDNPDYKPTLGSAANIYFDWSLSNNHGYASGSTFTFKLPEEFRVFNDVVGILDFDGDDVGTFTLAMDNTVVMTFNENIETLSNIEGTLFFETIIKEELQGDVEREIIFNIKDEDLVKIPVLFAAPTGSEIDKRGARDRAYNATSVNWSVDFNKQMKALDQAVFKDQLEANLALTPGSVKVYKLNVHLDGTVHQGEEINSSNYEITEDPFEIEFGDISSAYRVIYDTEITDDEATVYRNNVVIESNNQNDLSTGASVSTNRGQALEKYSYGYDAATQTITWKIEFNYNQKSISEADALLNDTFSNAHELIPGSFIVEEVSIDEEGEGSTVGVVTNYTLSPQNNEFDLQFNEDIDQAYLITYKTKATDRVLEDNVDIENTVTFGDNSKTVKQGTSQQVLSKGHSDINYRDKTVNWSIEVNRDFYEMKDIVIEDSFVNRGLSLKEDSFKVINTESGDELVRGVDYTLTNKGVEGYTLTFNQSISVPHRIQYVTEFEFDELLEEKQFRNNAFLSWETETGDTVEKEAGTGFAPDMYTQNNGFKNGSYNAISKEITWNIGVNYDLKSLDDIVVTDFIKGKQNLDENSIIVYQANLTGGSNGATKGDVLEKGIDYDLSFESNEDTEPGFVIEFPGNHSGAFWIEYKTSLVDELIVERYDNTAVLKSNGRDPVNLDAYVGVANGGSYVDKTGQQNGKVIDWNININFAQSTVSDAKVKDEQQNNQILVEKSFELFSTNVAQNGAVSKANKLEEGSDYELVIDTAEDGSQTFELSFNEEITEAYILQYQSFINADNNEVISNKATFLGEEITDNESTESNRSIQVRVSGGGGTGSGERGSLEVTKVDADSGETLEGAKFTLYDSEGEIEIRSLVTGADGIVTFTNLRYNDYVLKEDTAPEGYVVGIADQRPITIAGNEEVTIENKKITRHVELTKLDVDTREALSDAEFTLEFQEDGEWKVVAADLKVEDGTLTYEDLDAGTYRFIETKAPEFYQLDATPVEFTIGEQQTEITKVEKTNEIIKGSASLKKVDSVTGLELSGAVFRVVNEEGQTVQENIESNEDGLVEVLNLRPGSYQLIETKAPEFYQLDATPIDFEINAGSDEEVNLGDKVNVLVKGSIKLTKVDGDDKTPLTGAVFSLLDEEDYPVREGETTNAAGVLEITGLAPGTYQLKETEAPQDYQLNDEIFEVTIKPSNQTEVQWDYAVPNTLKTGSVLLKKIDDRDRSVLKDAVFSLFNSDDEEMYKDLKTNEDGEIEVTDLKPGHYYFVETSAPEHYLLDNEKQHDFIIVRGQLETEEIEVTNTLVPGAVSLVKVDEDDDTIVLADAKFELEDADGNVIASDLKTDETGRIIVEDLAPGTYYFIETDAPEHYELDATKHEVVVEKGQTQQALYPIQNQLKKGSVVIEKVDDITGEALVGAEFRLETLDSKVIEENLTTNSSGLITVSDLKPGEYRFVETKAPTDYVLNNEPIVFEIDKSQENALPLNVKNTLITGSVELTKVNLHDSSEALGDAEFSLLDSEGSILQSGLTTNKYGKLIVEDLAPGIYFFVETKAPADFVLNETPIPFEIERSQEKIALVTATNELIRGQVTLVKTDDVNPELFLAGATFELRDENGVVVATEKTKDDGFVTFTDVLPGEYELVEVEAPFGYDLDSALQPVIVERSQQEVPLLTKTNTLTPGSAVLTKTDSVDLSIYLDGAEFSLLDEAGEVLQNGLTTDENGQLKVDQLAPGDYQFVETKAPTHYVLDETPIVFTIEKGQEEDVQKTFTNTLKPGAAVLIKVDEDNEDVTLRDAEFKLVDENSNIVKGNLLTDDDGRIVVEDLVPGVYFFVETEAPEHYELDETEYEVIIEKGQTEAYSVTATNTLVKGSVVLEKVDSVDTSLLEGAVFRLETADGEEIEGSLTTDVNGRITVSDLKPGDYQFIEVKAPTDYEVNSEPILFEITKSQEEAIMKKAENTLTPGDVELVKVNKHDETEELNGAEFRIETVEGNSVREELITDENGKLVAKGLAPGKYQFVETKAPKDFKLDETPIPFEIDRSQLTTKTITATNELISGGVQLLKTDSLNMELGLSGAVFELRNEAGSMVASNATNEDGVLTFTDVLPGNYVLIEVEAPFGYDLDPTPQLISVDRNQQEILSLTRTNTLTPGSIVLTKVDSVHESLVLQGAEFVLQDKNGEELQTGLVTDENGQIILDQLAPGEYQLIETKAPEHYMQDETPILFTIEKGQEIAIEKLMTNSLQPGSVLLVKVDEGHKEVTLSGAEFQLEDSEGNVLQSGLETDENGRIIVEDLAPGTYFFIETKAPEHYQLDETPIEVVIDKGQTEASVIYVENALQTGVVVLEKLDSVDSTLLEGAKFNLLNSQNDVLKEDLITDENGRIIMEELKPGAYQFVETKAPEGYELDATPQLIEVEKGSNEAFKLIVTNIAIVPTPEEPGTPEEPVDQTPEEPGTPEEPVDQTPEEPGTPEEPVDQTPEEPGTPEEPVNPAPEDPRTPIQEEQNNVDDNKVSPVTTVNTGSKSGNKTDAPSVQKNGTLPQTGEEKYVLYLLVGILFMLIGVGVLIQNKRIRKEVK